jgi:hypothetical protein
MMMSYTATVALAASFLAASPQVPEWKASYGKALQATKESDQPLLVVLDKPNSENARLEPELLSEGSVAGESAEQLKKYQLCHVDVTSDYGKQVAKAFRATSFPHVAIIDKTGSVILARKSGKIDAAEWEKLLSKHEDGERANARRVSHVTYKPAEAVTYEGSLDFNSKPYCPSCQAKQF